MQQPSLPGSNVFNGAPLADLMSTQNTVRLQNPSDVLWLETTVGQKLYEGQTLLTLDESSAKIEFEPGDFLEVGPNSLIQIQRLKKGNDTELTLELLRGSLKGSLKGKSKQGIKLKNKNLEAQVSAQSTFEIVSSNDPTKTSQLLLTEGRANVLAGQQNQQVQAGELLEIKDGVADKQKTSISELPTQLAQATPMNEPKLIIDKPVEIQAQPVKKSVQYLRPPSKVKKPVFRKKSKSSHFLIDKFLNFLIPSAHADETPTEIIEYKRESWEIELEWESITEAKGYQIQISKTRAFEELHVDEPCTQNKYIWNYEPGMENSKGRVFYRIATINADGKPGEFSAPAVLEIPVELITKKVENKKLTTVKSVPPQNKTDQWLKFMIGAEMSQVSQTSGTQLLKEAKSNSLFLHERLQGSYLWSSTNDKKEKKFKIIDIDIRLESYKGSSGSSQPTIKPWSAEISGYKLSYAKPWFWGYGIAINRHYRFMKAGPRAVEGAGAFGLGPTLTALLFNKPVIGWNPVNFGAQLSVPITGIFLTSGYGIQAAAWSEWAVYKPSSGWIGLQTEIDGHYLLWKEPLDSKISRFSLSLNATWHSAF